MAHTLTITRFALGLVPFLSACAAPALRAAAACTRPTGPRVVYVNPLTHSGQVQLRLGDALLIELPTQNGGQWQLLQATGPVLLLQPNARPAGAVYQAVGPGPGTVFTFRATSAGVELVAFAPRPSGPYNSAGTSYNLRVEVAAADGVDAQQ